MAVKQHLPEARSELPKALASWLYPQNPEVLRIAFSRTSMRGDKIHRTVISEPTRSMYNQPTAGVLVSQTRQRIAGMDSDGDGYLSSREYTDAMELSLRRAAAANAISPCSRSVASISADDLQQHFQVLRAEYTDLFPQGLETPSDRAFNELASVNERTSRMLHRGGPSAAYAYAATIISDQSDSMGDAFAAFLEEMKRRRHLSRQDASKPFLRTL